MSRLAVPSIPESLAQSPTWPFVLRFALQLEERLAMPENQEKGNRWRFANPDALLNDASRHLAALRDLVVLLESDGIAEPGTARRLAVNVANFTWMALDVLGGLVPAGEEVTKPNAYPLPDASGHSDDCAFLIDGDKNRAGTWQCVSSCPTAGLASDDPARNE